MAVDTFPIVLVVDDDRIQVKGSGRQLAAEMRKAHPDLRVLYVTGNADGLFAPGQLLGQNESFLEKPVSPELLREAVNFLLQS